MQPGNADAGGTTSDSPANPSPTVSMLKARFSQGSEKDLQKFSGSGKSLQRFSQGSGKNLLRTESAKGQGEEKPPVRKPSDGSVRSVLLSKPLQAKAMAGSDMYKHAPDFAPPPSLSRDQAVRLFMLLSQPAGSGSKTPTGAETQTLSYAQMTDGLQNQPQVASMLGLPTKTAQEYHARRLFKLDLSCSLETAKNTTVTRAQFANYFSASSEAKSPASQQRSSSPQLELTKAHSVPGAANSPPVSSRSPSARDLAPVVAKPSTADTSPTAKPTGVPKLWRGGNTPRATDYDFEEEEAPTAATLVGGGKPRPPQEGEEDGNSSRGSPLASTSQRNSFASSGPRVLQPVRRLSVEDSKAATAAADAVVSPAHSAHSPDSRELQRRLSVEDSRFATATADLVVSPSHSAHSPHSRPIFFPMPGMPGAKGASPPPPVPDPPFPASVPLDRLPSAPLAHPRLRPSGSLPPPSPNENPLPERTPQRPPSHLSDPLAAAVLSPSHRPSSLPPPSPALEGGRAAGPGRVEAPAAAHFWQRVKQLAEGPAPAPPPAKPGGHAAPWRNESAADAWLAPAHAPAPAPAPAPGPPPHATRGQPGTPRTPRMLRPSPVAGDAARSKQPGQGPVMAQLSARGEGSAAGRGSGAGGLYTGAAEAVPKGNGDILLETFLVVPQGTSLLALQRSLQSPPEADPVYWIKT